MSFSAIFTVYGSEDPEVEGILDGGHTNMLAIGLHMLRQMMEEDDWKRIKFTGTT